MDDKLTKAEYALLSLLIEKPAHGYDLEQTIEQRDMREWTELAFSSIYYVLKKLEERGQIESLAKASSGKRARKVFASTEAGRELHNKMTLKFLGQAENLYPAVLLGLANWPSVDQKLALETLKLRKTELMTIHKGLTVRSQVQAQSQPDFVDAMFDYSLTHLKAEIDWINRTLDKLGDSS